MRAAWSISELRASLGFVVRLSQTTKRDGGRGRKEKERKKRWRRKNKRRNVIRK